MRQDSSKPPAGDRSDRDVDPLTEPAKPPFGDTDNDPAKHDQVDARADDATDMEPEEPAVSRQGKARGDHAMENGGMDQ